MQYSLGLDIGTNSIGWCLIGYSPAGEADRILNMGARIFSDGREAKSEASLAVARREKRAMRRSRDRYLRRRAALLQRLIEAGLMPLDKAERKTLESVNPYVVRAAALDGQIPLHQIGRALFHLNQRRGFKSNRKTDKGDKESGKISFAVQKLRDEMYFADARTYGEFLAKRLAAGEPLRIRMRDGEGPVKPNGEAVEGYAFYPDRAMLEEEFHAIWDKQAEYYPDILTNEPNIAVKTPDGETALKGLKDVLFDTIFYQRPLKSPEVGLCTLLGGDQNVPLEERERRLPKSDPLFQQRRLLEELNALKIERGPGTVPEPLTREQRDTLLMAMKGKKSAGFRSLAKVLKLGDAVFNKERAGRDKLLGDEVFAEMAHKTRFGPAWSDVPLERQREIVAKVREEENGETLVSWLMDSCGLDEARARAVASAKLPEGYGRFGETASRVLIRELTEYEIDGRVCVYSEAVDHSPELGHHSDERTGEVKDKLPYYGETLQRHIIPGTGDPADGVEKCIGKLTNPTVHIGLNQLRRLINKIVETYGLPNNIIVEIGRDLKANDRQKVETRKWQKQNREAAEKRSKKLEELGQPDTGRNRALLKLWEDLNPDDPFNRVCIYTGETISPAMLFSGEVDVDHILPWSRTLDDSNANKLVCLARANRIKRNKTPHEAWGDTDQWPAILQRAENLPPNKAKRFSPDAMEKYGGENEFLARHLVDTQYLSILAKKYLEEIVPNRVYVSTGHLTSMLRRHWGLDSCLPDHNFAQTAHRKNRKDHRHHAIDAAVLGVLSLGLIQKISREAGRREASELEDVIGSIAPPWEGFRDDVIAALDKTVVSHRPDHGTIGGMAHNKAFDQTAGRLHNETAYGLTGLTDGKDNTLVVHRVPIGSLKRSHLDDGGAHIRDDELRARLREATAGAPDKEFTKAVLEFSRKDEKFKGIRRVRVIEPLSVIPIRDKDGVAYKGHKGDANYCYDVWQLPDGKWKHDVISMFDAHTLPPEEQNTRKPHPAAKRIMRLQQNDMVAYEDEKYGTGIGRVVKFDQAGSLYIADHNESGALKARDAADNDEDPFKYFKAAASRLKSAKVRKIHVDELGRVKDPGPRS